jgi:hypothetical protein
MVAEQPKSPTTEWHTSLLATLRDAGVRQAEPGLAIVYYFQTFLFVGAITFGAKIYWESLGPLTPFQNIIASIVAILLFVGILGRLVSIAHRNFLRATARNAERELMRQGSRRPVLFLRSFEFDKATSKGQLDFVARLFNILNTPGTVEEEVIKQLKPCGPVIAIGRPEEKLPPLGAARFYVSHDRWKDIIAELARVCQLVLWTTGDTEGLKWEISHLVQSVPPGKLIIWVHVHVLRMNAADREREWGRFLSSVGPVFPKALPPKIGNAKFLYFDSTFTPIAAVDIRSMLLQKGYVFTRIKKPV